MDFHNGTMAEEWKEISKMIAIADECFEDEVRRLVSQFQFRNSHKLFNSNPSSSLSNQSH